MAGTARIAWLDAVLSTNAREKMTALNPGYHCPELNAAPCDIYLRFKLH